jgi:hypothetical protein
MLPLDARTGAEEAQEPSSRMAPERPSDIAIADAIVHTVRAVPSVFDMGQGLFAKAATFGTGKHVPGVVIQHPTSDTLWVEAQIILEEAAFNIAIFLFAKFLGGDFPLVLRW